MKQNIIAENFLKKYKNTPGHRLYKIEDVAPNGDLTLRGERYKGEMEEDEL